LDEIKVYLYGTTIEVPLSGSGPVYTFRMPAGNITIVAVFGSITAIDEIGRSQLRAWTQNGTMYVSGLTAGQLLSVYNITGTLIYRDAATPDSSSWKLVLPSRGVYMICSENTVIKVVY
jgi:hypothetical protein